MRKSRITRRTVSILGIAGAAALSSRAHAQTYTWDPAGTSGAGSDGAGAWNTTAGNLVWEDGGAAVVWPNTTSDNAVIGSGTGAAGTITVGAGGVTLGNITFDAAGSGNYHITGGTLGMTGGTPTITVSSGVTAEIDAPISVTGSQPDVTVNGAGTLEMNPTAEGSNYHGLILGGTSNVILLSAAAVPIVIPNDTTAANFDGGTLTFAATPSTDVSGRFTTTSSSAVNIAVTNGAVVTFGSPISGSGGLNVSGSGTGSTLELTESGGSQVAYTGSGGVDITGATLYFAGPHNTEVGSNAVTVGANGVMSSSTTQLITSGATTVNGRITGGDGDLSGDTYGNMHLSATTFSATGAYVWKLNTAPSAAYHSGSIVNSVLTGGAANANSGTNFDSLFMTSLTDTAVGFGIDLVTTVGGGTALAPGNYEFAIANTASGTFNTANFSYTGFSLADVPDSSLSAANNGGVNSELDGGTGQDLVLTYSVPEPASFVLAAATFVPLMLVRRRRNAH